jgi:hypothetical protein
MEADNPTVDARRVVKSRLRWVVEFDTITQSVTVEGDPVSLDFTMAILGMAREAVRDQKRAQLASRSLAIAPANLLPDLRGRVRG